MSFNRKKFKTLVHYIVWRTSHTEGFGAIKLNKVLWFAEARVFEAHGKLITGESFVRDSHGPRSKHLRSVLLELEDEGVLEPFVERVFDYTTSRYRAQMAPGDSLFTSDELTMIDWWIAHIADKHTAGSISKLSHDYGWEVAKMGEELPLRAFLAKRIRQLETEDEKLWAQKEIERLGLR